VKGAFLKPDPTEIRRTRLKIDGQLSAKKDRGNESRKKNKSIVRDSIWGIGPKWKLGRNGSTRRNRRVRRQLKRIDVKRKIIRLQKCKLKRESVLTEGPRKQRETTAGEEGEIRSKSLRRTGNCRAGKKETKKN